MATQHILKGESLLKPILFQCPKGRWYVRSQGRFIRLDQTAEPARSCADSAREMHERALRKFHADTLRNLVNAISETLQTEGAEHVL